jgi:hypothetical protein
LIGEVITFCGQEYRVLAHKGDYIKAIEMAESPFPLIKLLPFNKVQLPENVLKNIQIEELWNM